MSLEGIVWAMKLKAEQLADVPAAAHVTLIMIANFTDDMGRNAWPSRHTLAEARGLSVKTIGRHLTALEEAGLIVRGDQEYVRHIQPNRRPVVWSLGHLGGTSDVPSKGLWGDTLIHSGGTPGVPQSLINPSVEEVTYLSQDGIQRANIAGPGYENRDCVHGTAATTYVDKRSKRLEPMCPYCRKAGAITLAPIDEGKADA